MFRIDSTSSTPVYEQIIDRVKEYLLKGVMSPGDKLPSVREMAKITNLNPNTVQKAYQELEKQKITITKRGRGTFISSDYILKNDRDKEDEIKENIKKAIIDAHYIGYSKKDIYGLIDKIVEDLEVVDND